MCIAVASMKLPNNGAFGNPCDCGQSVTEHKRTGSPTKKLPESVIGSCNSTWLHDFTSRASQETFQPDLLRCANPIAAY
jgi:hypothetical protein